MVLKTSQFFTRSKSWANALQQGFPNAGSRPQVVRNAQYMGSQTGHGVGGVAEVLALYSRNGQYMGSQTGHGVGGVAEVLA